jgi:hypothetical protein
VCEFELTHTKIKFNGTIIECVWTDKQLFDMAANKNLVTYNEALVQIWTAIFDAGLDITDEEEQYIRDYTRTYFFKI